jgi:hypothetical protein
VIGTHPRPRFPPRAVRVVLARDDLDPTLMTDHIAVPQPERLTDPHPGPCQQREQEPVPQARLRRQDRGDLLRRQGRQRPTVLPQAPDTPARLGPGDPMQKRLEATTRDPSLVNQHLGDLHSMAGVELLEAEHRREDPVDRRRRPRRPTRLQHHHVLRR